MTAPIDKVRGEGNCGRVTDRGEEARECVRKCRPDCAAGRILTEAARLRTETSYKAGSIRRVSTTSRSRSQAVAQVNGELVQRNITRLSGETCQTARRPSFAPASKACLKGGTRRSNPQRARQESAEVVVPILEVQSRREGPNDEEQGGVIVNPQRGNLLADATDRSGDVRPETIGSLSRSGRTAAARAEQPALGLFPSLGWRPWSTRPIWNEPEERESEPSSEPPSADPHARWCGEGHRAPSNDIANSCGFLDRLVSRRGLRAPYEKDRKSP